MSLFSHISKALPEFSKYLHGDTAKACIQKMATAKKGKPLIKFVKSALEQQKWQTDPQLKSLLDCAVKQKWGKEVDKKISALKKIFKSQILEESEKNMGSSSDSVREKYELAKLHMDQKNHIPALSLLQSTRNEMDSSSDLSMKKVKEKIVQCQKKVKKEVESIEKSAKKLGIGSEVSDFSKKDMPEKVKKILQKSKELLPVEAALIRLYTPDFYTAINLYLRDKSEFTKFLKKEHIYGKEKEELISFIQKSVPIVKHSLEKMASLKDLYPTNSSEDIRKRTVFRGISVSKEYIEDLQKKVTVVDPGFGSASTDIDVALGFAAPKKKSRVPLLFIIDDEEGSGVPIDKLSHTKDEAEILFRPDTEFQVKSIGQHHLLGYRLSSRLKNIWIATVKT